MPVGEDCQLSHFSRPRYPSGLRSTKSLFGEAEFRQAKSDQVKCRRSNSSNHKEFCRKKTCPERGERFKRSGSCTKRVRRKDHLTSAGITPETGAICDGLEKSLCRQRPKLVDACLRRVVAPSADGGWNERSNPDIEFINDNFSPTVPGGSHRAVPPAGSSRAGASPPRWADLASYPVNDTDGREGSKSSSSRSSQWSSSTSADSKQWGCTEMGTRSVTGRCEYEGIYESDDDLDTSAWDLGTVHGISDGGDGGNAVVATSSQLGSEDEASLDRVLDAIDSEVDSTTRKGAWCSDPDERGIDDISAEGRDASPDPGALESQRERNARLARMLHAISRHLDFDKSKEETAPRDGDRCDAGEFRGASDRGIPRRREGTVATGKWILGSAAQQARSLEVLLKVMDRPLGPVDASPASTTNLPGLLAAKLVLQLVLPSLFIPHADVESHDANSEPGEGGGTRGQQLLIKACRHLFDVSKQAGTDDAFFSSGTVACLLELLQLAASELASVSMFPCTEESTKDQIGVDGGTHTHISNKGNNSSRGSNKDCTDYCGNICDGGAGRLCDALTFAVGCLKNVSASEGLQHTLVQAGAVSTLCRLVRTTRDVCRRCEGPRPQKACPPPSGTARTDGVRAELVTGLKGEERAGRGDWWSHNTSFLRRQASPPLAQSINLLCDLAVGNDTHNTFRDAGAVGALCSVLRPFRNQLDVVLNAARALAKLSLQEGMRAEINSDSAHARELLAALVEQGEEIGGNVGAMEELGGRESTVAVEQRRHWEREGKRVAACVRLAFTLGNLTSASDDNRKLIGLRLGGVNSLPALLQTSSRAHLAAWERFASTEESTPDDTGYGTWASEAVVEDSWSRKTLRSACDVLEDMLVKTVRLVANISINRTVGQHVCRHPGLTEVEPLLEKCLEVFQLFEDGILPGAPRLKSRGHRKGMIGPHGKSKTEPIERLIPGEELLLNVVSLVTNLSFYGPDTHDLAPVGCTRRASGGGSAGENSCSGGGSATDPTDKLPNLNTLFTLASKARREDHDAGNFPTKKEGTVGHESARGVESAGGSAVSRPPKAPSSCLPVDHGAGCGRDVLCGHLVKVLFHPNVEAVTEAARAFGNFSRDPFCREAMARRRADEVLVALLGHTCRDVVVAATGALVNVAADPARKVLLYREGIEAGERLARLVRRSELADDPGMAEIACQALHNLLIEPLPPGGVEEALGGAEIYRQLRSTLVELMETSFCGQADISGGGRLLEGEEGGVPGDAGGFPAAAAAVWRAMCDGVGRRPNFRLYEEL